MSQMRRMAELKPPTHGMKEETLVSVGHRCEYCQGNGWFWGMDEFGQGVKKRCPVCEGKGELDAVITIKWQPTCKE